METSVATLEREQADNKRASDTARALNRNRFGWRWINHLKAMFGPPSMRRLAYASLQIPLIRHWEKEFGKLSDKELLALGLRMKGRARGGESLDRMLPEVFGLVSEAAWRNVRLRPFDVQLAAGVVLHNGAIAEVATGEGKTLIGTLPSALNALQGKGAHVTTVNDYLALRDCDWCAQIFSPIGISTGVLQQKMDEAARVLAYKADVTYGTAAEFGFDFLRDRLKLKGGMATVPPFWAAWSRGGPVAANDPKVQREHHFALVDEADNIFVDEARTPLIVANPTRLAAEEETVVYRWADQLARQMVRDDHFFLDDKKQKLELSEKGRHLIRYSNPPRGKHSHAMDKLHEHVERALQVHYRFKRDQHYLVEFDDEKGYDRVCIIDEATGRRMPDRHWQDGLHQAAECKEGLNITVSSDHAAQVTYQSYFRFYKKLCGMSGTVVQNWFELLRVYKLWTVQVPTNRPCLRKHSTDRILPNEDAKFAAVTEEIGKLQKQGRPVLVGTRTVDRSEELSRRLTAAGIPHKVLNARPGAQESEADIIAQAGRPGAITIATNMAGRGTDILLGGNAEAIAWSRLREQYQSRLDVPKEVWHQVVETVEIEQNIKELRKQVVAAGGLHVLATERNDAKRIDRQLVGRAARQGDPGSSQFFLALDDQLLEALGPDSQAYYEELGKKGGNRNWQKYQPLFEKCQNRQERRHYRQRLDLMMYEKNRQEVLKDLGADPYVD